MIRTICTLALAAMLLALELTIPAQADESGDPGKLMLVLDSSGSMKEKVAGTTKIAAAKDALGTVIDKLPANQQVGLRVYGAKVFSAKDKGACTDSQRAVDLGTDNRTNLKSAVAKYKPYGETPTGYALQQAGKDLGKDGQRTIVLVSDGESTCSPDPCKVAAELAESGVQLHIDVIGLNVSGKARNQLQCIAGSGNGSYYDAQDADDLVGALDTLSTRAARPYESIGQRITGSQSPTNAPAITAGDWKDVLGGAGSDKRELFYKLSDFDPTSTLHVSATINQPLGGNDKINVDIVRAKDLKAEDACARDSDLDLGAAQVGLLSPSVSWSYDAAKPKDECKPDDLLLRVRRGWDWTYEKYDGGGNNDLPVEIRIIEEPAIVRGQPLPSKQDDGVFQIPPKTTDRTALTGGSSFSDAPTIKPGAYTDTIVPGETQIFLVDVGWGQSLQSQVILPKLTGALKKQVGVLGPYVTTEIYSPARAVATKLIPRDSDGETTNNRAELANELDLKSRAITAPIRYNNRQFLGGSSVENDAAAALAGKYAIVIHTDTDKRSNVSYQVPVTFDVNVVGDVTGVPKYASTPKKIGQNPPPASRAVAAAKKDDGGIPVLPIGLGLVGVALLSGAYVVFRRSRQLS
jgi:Ca-activated chloride channel family protein